MVHRYNKDTQQKILKEAADLFMSKGYLGTSTREI
ncbi:TetR/AcrR family transcriptional regulator, partial [Enterococcus faecium]|nr:TetR/AcrR family transcriptional regulator [Enterococcus faecium]